MRGTISVILQLHQILRLPRKWVSGLILLTYETSCTMRGATALTLQPQQILRLRRKINLMIYLAHIWNVIYDAGSNRTYTPTSPNTAPAKQNDTHDWSCSQMKRHDNARINSTHPPTSPNIAPATQNDMPKYEENVLKTVEAVIYNARPTRPWSEHDPSMKLQNWTRPFGELTFLPHQHILYWKLQHFALRLSILQISPNIAPAKKSDSPRSPNVAPATKSDTPTSPNFAPATKSDTATSPNAMLATSSDAPTSPNSVPATESFIAELLLCWTVASLSCYFTELWRYWAVILLNCYCTVFFWTVTSLNCYFLELLLDWTVTELLLYWTVTLLSCYFTELLLYWTVIWLNCYFTDLAKL